jgi:hypothetical protein
MASSLDVFFISAYQAHCCLLTVVLSRTCGHTYWQDTLGDDQKGGRGVINGWTGVSYLPMKELTLQGQVDATD